MKEIMMVKHKSSTSGFRFRIIHFILAFVLMFGCIIIPDTQAKASSLSVGVSASSVKIGDTVTVSITVPAGVSATVNVTYPTSIFSFSSASDTANSNGGTVSMTIGGYGSTNTKTTGTMKFKAKAAGSATFSASAPIAGNQEGDRVTVGGASASVRVKNESNDSDSNSGNGGGSSGDNGSSSDNGENKKKSADNSLSSLTLSSGTLSPKFQYNVTNYTAEVDHSVTSVVVSAKTSNAKASVESLKGGENLVVGANKIQIVVKAENGVTATYTITVTRKAADDEQGQDTPDDEETGETNEPQEQFYEVNGVKLYPSSEGDEAAIPEGFELREITLWEKAYPYWVNEKIGSGIGLIYLVDENQQNGAWYRVSETSLYQANPFICLYSEYGYIIAVPELMTQSVPQGYKAETINIEGKGIADVYVKNEDEQNCLIYAVNQDGVFGLYRYDVQDRTYMRYVEEQVAEDTQVVEPEEPSDDSASSELESQNRMLFYAFIIVVAFLLIIIIILVIMRKRDRSDEYEEYDEYDEYDEDNVASENNETGEETDEADEEADDVAETDEEINDELAYGNVGVADKADDIAIEHEKDNRHPTNPSETLDLEAVLAQAVAESMQEESISEEPEKKEKKRGLFRRKKESAQQDDDLEFLDL